MSIEDMFDDAFTAIARDGAGCVEVGIHLQKALTALCMVGDESMKEATKRHAELSLKRSQIALPLDEDFFLQAVKSASMLGRD